MGRKRKNADAAVARITRVRSTLPSRNRTVSFHTTATGRLGQSTSFLASADPPSAPAVYQAAHDSTPSWELQDDALPEDVSESDPEVELNDSPLQEWSRFHRDAYLDEMLRHEGRAGDPFCDGECEKEGLFKCKDCFGGQLYCHECFVERHSHLPFHRVLVRFLQYSQCALLIDLYSTGLGAILRTSPSKHSASKST